MIPLDIWIILLYLFLIPFVLVTLLDLFFHPDYQADREAP